MFNNINLNILKYFHEIANTKNITKASENLNISQPALTKALKQLESDLSVKLFIRNKRGVILTEAGKILQEYTFKSFQSLKNTINVIEQEKENGAHLYIGASTTNFLEPILPILQRFKELYPKIKIEIVLEEIDKLEKYSKLGKLDILIKNSYEKMENFENIFSFDIQDCFIASKKDYPEFINKKFSLKELIEKYPFVLLSDITHGRRNFDAYLKSQNIFFKPTYEFNSYSLCKELIRKGFGIGLGNPMHYKEEDFIVIKTNFSLPKRSFNIGFIKTSKNEYLKDFKILLKKI